MGNGPESLQEALPVLEPGALAVKRSRRHHLWMLTAWVTKRATGCW